MERNNTPPTDNKSTSKDEPLDEILKFLYGEIPLDGLWFGDSSPDKPPFWWRTKLRETLPSYVATEVLKELRDFAGVEDDDWTGNVAIPQQRLVERIKFWEGKS